MHFSVCIAWLAPLLSISADAGPEPPQRTLQIGSASNNPFDPAFDRFVEDLLQAAHVPGLSVAIVDDGQIYSKGYGFAVLPAQKATADTQYFTGSTTKAFTAAAAGLLVHDNVNHPSIQWTAPINSIIRADFVLEDEWATNHVSIEDALSHCTGLPDHGLILCQEGDTVSRVVQRLRYLPMVAEPRVEWNYCNVMYAVITDLIQTVTGRDIETVLEESIWEPLSMRSTTFTVPPRCEERSRLARGYYWNSDTTTHHSPLATHSGEYIPERDSDMLCTVGDGAIISTVNDYALWIKALINAAGDEGSWNSSMPISRSLYRDLVTPRAIIPLAGGSDGPDAFIPPLYAMGWVNSNVAGLHLLSHGGTVAGFGTDMFILPGLKYGVVTMQNTLSEGIDPGYIIAARFILEKLNLNSSDAVDELAIRESLLQARKAILPPIATRHREKSPVGSSFAPFPEAEDPSYALALHKFAGLYTHPAYGAINLTIAPSSSLSSEVLEGIFYPRTDPEREVLIHVVGTLFRVRSFQPHGLGDIASGDGIVWQDITDDDLQAHAVFDFGIDGETVEVLGIDLEPTMIRKAKVKGRKFWRENMIWFSRA